MAAVSQNPAPGPAPALALSIGDYGAGVTPVIEGGKITRPSFAGDSQTVWTVVDDTRVTQVTQMSGNSQVTEREVDSSAIRAVAQGPITELQVSQDGARAALIVGGQVVLAIIEDRTDGRLLLSNPLGAAALNIVGAVSLDWLSSEMLVVGRSSTEGPVVQLRIDGMPPGALPSGNLTPPVTAVVASPSTIYAADSRGILRLGGTGDEPDQYWSEVPPTMGYVGDTRSATLDPAPGPRAHLWITPWTVDEARLWAASRDGGPRDQAGAGIISDHGRAGVAGPGGSGGPAALRRMRQTGDPVVPGVRRPDLRCPDRGPDPRRPVGSRVRTGPVQRRSPAGDSRVQGAWPQ